MGKLIRFIRRAYARFLDRVQSPLACKHRHAFRYWKNRVRREGTLSHDHFAHFYTTHFGLDRDFYRGKKILDIGCGPRGSLEWADVASERVGLDSLANAYRRLGTHRHRMTYVDAPAENIPFPDEHFDVVCSFNSLDHVDDLDRVTNEIHRVLAPGGLVLVITDVHDTPRIREPQTFKWEVVDRFVPPLELLQENRYERSRAGMYESIQAGTAYDESDESERYGVLSAKFAKPGVID